MAYDCEKAQTKLRAAWAKKSPAEAWDISNTMRAHGCVLQLSGLPGKAKSGKKRRKARKARRRR